MDTKPNIRMACLRAAVATLCATVFAAAGVAQGATAEQVETTRTALEKWVETNRLIGKEKRDWKIGREILKDRIELVKSQIESLREKIKKDEESIAETKKKKDASIAKSKKYEDMAESLRKAVAPLEARTSAIVKRLPEPALERVETLSQQIPTKPDETKLQIGVRMRNVIGVLNELNKFNRGIVVTRDVRQIDEQNRAEVSVFYVGLGRAYFANVDGTIGGVGMAGPESWEWSLDKSAAAEIAKTVKILDDEEIADFVPLPIRLKR